jgi:hypothetical protein
MVSDGREEMTRLKKGTDRNVVTGNEGGDEGLLPAVAENWHACSQ